MGQDNEKIQFENQNQVESKRRAIFKNAKDAAPLEYCDIPGCKCPLQHGEYDMKVCDECQEQPPPFMRSKNYPSYYKDDYSVKEEKQKLPQPYPHRQLHQAQSIPTKISYYNAWSLPTQKYYLRDRPHFQNRAQHKHEQIPSEQSRQSLDTIIRRDITERLMYPAEPVMTEQDRKRRQNMNLPD